MLSFSLKTSDFVIFLLTSRGPFQNKVASPKLFELFVVLFLIIIHRKFDLRAMERAHSPPSSHKQYKNTSNWGRVQLPIQSILVCRRIKLIKSQNRQSLAKYVNTFLWRHRARERESLSFKGLNEPWSDFFQWSWGSEELWTLDRWAKWSL